MHCCKHVFAKNANMHFQTQCLPFITININGKLNFYRTHALLGTLLAQRCQYIALRAQISVGLVRNAHVRALVVGSALIAAACALFSIFRWGKMFGFKPASMPRSYADAVG